MSRKQIAAQSSSVSGNDSGGNWSTARLRVWGRVVYKFCTRRFCKANGKFFLVFDTLFQPKISFDTCSSWLFGTTIRSATPITEAQHSVLIFCCEINVTLFVVPKHHEKGSIPSLSSYIFHETLPQSVGATLERQSLHFSVYLQSGAANLRCTSAGMSWRRTMDHRVLLSYSRIV